MNSIMTIEEKAKAYDEARARMSKAYNDNRCSFYFMKEIFPEPKVPKDNNMRLTIIQFLEYASSYGCPDILSKEKAKTWIAWLEKQGESKFESCIQEGDKIVTNDDGTHFNVSQLERVAKKKPKFKVGDWVVRGKTIAQILDIQEQYYVGIDTNGNDFTSSRFLSDDKIHLWTIQDAKDGDVLSTSAGAFIYNGNNGGGSCPGSYCGIDTLGGFKTGVKHHWTGKPVFPSTKEQRNLLFQKMKEAGYTFDFEKKELKRIESKPAIEIKTPEESLGIDSDTYNKIVDECIYGEQKPAWSEEDDEMLDSAIGSAWAADYYTYDDKQKIENELKSLKERMKPQWKPSDEQMKALDWALSLAKNCGEECAFDLRTLLEQLKKLKEE